MRARTAARALWLMVVLLATTGVVLGICGVVWPEAAHWKNGLNASALACNFILLVLTLRDFRQMWWYA